jgi:ABC-type antimicrobial peptide transport system permease subunit
MILREIHMRMLLDIVRQSLSTLWAHKLRSFLTMFGIAWGVGSLLLLVGLGEGFRSGQEKQLATLGQNIMFMFPGRSGGGRKHAIRADLLLHVYGLPRDPQRSSVCGRFVSSTES